MAFRVFYFWATFVLVLCNFVHPHEIDIQTAWTQFQLQFNKSYATSEEHTHRFGIFEDNLAFIIHHNMEEDLGMHSYRLGITPMADLTHEEYKEIYSSCLLSNNEDTSTSNQSSVPETSCVPPKTYDYRKQGFSTPVRDQLTCGGCYAFATAGTVEIAWMKSTNRRVDLSPQNIVDCSVQFGNAKCAGGYLTPSYEYMQYYGVDTELSYPYVNRNQNCKYNQKNVGAWITGYYIVRVNDLQALKQAVACVNPVAVGFNADGRKLEFYRSGVYDGKDCGSTPTHAVFVVGYGELRGKLYWIMKNSWGPHWGERGYFKMIGDTCQLLSMPACPK